MNKNYYENIVRLILKELRGEATQKSMSEKLGFSYNKWFKWESGEKRVMWDDLFLVLEDQGIDIRPEVSRLVSKKFTGEILASELLSCILQKFGRINDPNFFTEINLSKSTLYRYFKTSEVVPASLIFQMLDVLSPAFPYFVSTIIKDPKTKELKKIFEKFNVHELIEFGYPWVSVIEAFIDTKEYRDLETHSDQVIAKKFKMNLKQVQFALKSLCSIGAIELKDQKYTLITKRVDLLDIHHSAKFVRYWTEKALDRFKTTDGLPLSKGGWSSRVFPVSKEGKEAILEARLEFINKIMQILKDDHNKTKEHIQIMALHLFECSDLIDLELLHENTN